MASRSGVVQSVLETLTADRLRELLLHWDDVRRGRRMPAWEDIDPAAITRELPIIWSWKYVRETDSFRGRFAGEEINEIFGKSLRGAEMKEFFSDMEFDRVFRKHRRVVTEPCIAVGSGYVFVHAHRHGVGERLILPLARNGIDGDGIIGATTYSFEDPPAGAAKLPPAETVTYFPI